MNKICGAVRIVFFTNFKFAIANIATMYDLVCKASAFFEW
jgi:hypothetical protein